ncbi:hypothetical protein Micbo1qcDRAFT_160647, partial [Microdochium bolleyi]
MFSVSPLELCGYCCRLHFRSAFLRLLFFSPSFVRFCSLAVHAPSMQAQQQRAPPGQLYYPGTTFVNGWYLFPMSTIVRYTHSTMVPR